MSVILLDIGSAGSNAAGIEVDAQSGMDAAPFLRGEGEHNALK